MYGMMANSKRGKGTEDKYHCHTSLVATWTKFCQFAYEA